MRVETKAFNQEAELGLISLVEPDGGSLILHALLAEKSAGRETVQRGSTCPGDGAHTKRRLHNIFAEAFGRWGGGDGFGV